VNAVVDSRDAPVLAALIARCRAAGVALAVDGENLRVKLPAGGAPPELIAELRASKGAILDLLRSAAPRAGGAITRAANRARAPLSFGQESMWLAHQLSGGDGMLNFCAVLHLEGEVDRRALALALDGVVARHTPLRTLLPTDENGRPWQQVLESVSIPIEELDLAALDADSRAARADAAIAEAFRQPFDLQRDHKCRALLVRLGAREFRFAFITHHITSDGWSIDVLLKEFGALYNAAHRGVPAGLAPLAIDFVDYAIWEQANADSDWFRAGVDYWAKRLAGAPALHALPLDRARPAVQSLRMGRHEWLLPRALLEEAEAFARSRGITLFVLLSTALGLLCSRYSRERDVIIGTPIANRLRAELAPLIGLFVNVLAQRFEFAADESVDQILRRAQRDYLQDIERQNVPFDRVVAQHSGARARSHAPLVQIMFVLHNNELASLALDGLTCRADFHTAAASQYDLAIAANEISSGLRFVWEYAADLFDASRIERMATHFVTLLGGMLRQPALRPVQLPLDDGARLRAQFGAAPPEFQGAGDFAAAVHQRVLEHARAFPRAPAIASPVGSLTYGELVERATQLAARLTQEAALMPGDAVGVGLPKSPDSIVALLAVFLAGGVYVPIDAETTAARLEFCARDARWRVLVGRGSRPGALPQDCHWLALDAPGTTRGGAAFAPCLSTTASAYVIYTSGSTGEPKGVVVGHAALARHIAAMRAVFGITREDRVLQFANTAFDASLEQIFVALCAGACLHLRADRELAVAGFVAWLDAERITVADLPVAYARELVGEIVARGAAPALSLRLLIIGGEVLPVALAREWRALALPRWLRILNAYGPTEAVITSSVSELGSTFDDPLPIGRAVGGRRLYVLDELRTPCPEGVIGDLWIGGEALATGYLNRPDLTAERFCLVEGERLYRSGDLAFWRADGELAFVGRADRQLKLRGFRIEPGEIENAMRRHEAVRDCVVVLRPGEGATSPDASLVAYVVAQAGGATPEPAAWRELLALTLPRHMIPSAFVTLERLPVNHAGKLDTRLLPAPPEPTREVARAAPTSPTEIALVALWREVLGRDGFGIDDNFFSLGGDSIQAIQVVARAARQGLALSTQLLFEHQSIRALAPFVKTGARIIAPQHELAGDTPLLPAQRQFLEESAVDVHHFNQALLLTAPAGFDQRALMALVEALYRRHDALRLTFDTARRETASFRAFDASLVAEALAPPLAWRARDADEFTARVTAAAEAAQRQLDPRTGRLVRVQWIDGGADRRRLLIVIHHLAVDGVSWRILLEDLEAAWGQLARGATLQLEAKSSSVQQWGVRLAEFAREPRLAAQRAWWLAQLQAAPLPRELDAREIQPMASTAVVPIALSAAETRDLLGRCHEAWNTRVNDLLLAALWKALADFSGDTRVAVMLEGHGREPLSGEIDLGATVGWFTSTFPVLLMGDALDTGATVRAVKEHLRAIPDNGLGFGVLRHLAEDAEIVAAESGRPVEVVFNYLGQFDTLLSTDSAFALADEPTGALHSPARPRAHRLGFNGMVRGGCLRLELDYSREQYREETMRALAASLERALREVIACCLAAPRGGRTPSDYPHARATQTQLDAWRRDFPKWSKLYDATLMQQGLLFHSVLDEERGAYNASTALELASLDVPAFKAAWHRLVQRFDVLRTAFVALDSGAQQLVLDRVEVPWIELDWRERDELSRRRDWLALQRADLTRSFDVAAPPLMRLTLVRIAADRYYFLWTHHHMILDGWCMPIVFGDLFALYRAEVAQQDAALAEPVPYQRYIGWLRAQDHEAARAWWRSSLAGLATPTSLGLERANPQGSESGAGSDAWLKLDLPTSEALRRQARESGITQSALVQAAWAYLLHRYSGERRVTFGATVSGRPADLPGVEQCVGLFINTLPVSVEIDGDEPLSTWLARLHAAGLERDRYSYLSLAEIQQLSPLPRGTALFDTLLVFESYPVDVEVANRVFGGRADAGSFSIENFAAADPTHYGLTLIVLPGEEWGFRLSYDAARYERGAAEGVLRHLGEVLRSLAAGHLAEGRPRGVRDLNWLPADERRELVTRWNETARDFSTAPPLPELIARRAAATPDAPALEFRDEALSYAELEMRANALARHLAREGIGSGAIVGVCLERGTELVVSLLGILKAGAAYLPLDPAYPRARLAYMLADAVPSAVLCAAATREALPEGGCRRLDWSDPQFLAALACGAIGPAAEGARPRGLAYLIYTSGSTGQPKGVMLEHASVSNFLLAMLEAPGLAARDRLLAVTSTSFDIHVLEIFAPLVAGGTVVIAAQDEYADPAALDKLLRERRVTVMQATPSTWLALIESGWQPTRPLKALCGGEALPERLKQKLLACAGLELWNMYGPTETCVWSAVKRIEDEVLVGLPIANTTFQVLDARLEPMPVGAVGDLYIGGAGLARGYHARPELTAGAFIAAPAELGGARLYRSGDRVRRRASGELEFLGRADHQVKIRGFRIEIGEIVDAIESLAGVRQAAVVVRTRADQSRYLAASVVPHDDAASSSERIAASLAERLPAHMIPTRIELVRQLPMTPNGKVDLKALAAAETNLTTVIRTAPSTRMEQELCELWRELLALPADAPGVDEDLIELGADSIRVLMFVGRAAKRGIEVRAREVYRCRHVRALALAARAAERADARRRYEGPAALTVDQCAVLADERVWRRFYINCVFDLVRPLDVALVQRALDAVCGLHDALRARFVRVDSGWRQDIVAGRSAAVAAVELAMAWDDIGAVPRLRELLEDVQRGLSIETGPTIYLLAVTDTHGVQKLLLTVSHLVADGFSMSVLLDDLFEIYAGLVTGTPREPRPGLPMDAWAPRYRELVASPAFRAQLDFWEALPWQRATPLPLDRPAAFDDGSNTCATSGAFVRACDAAITARLQELPPRFGISTPDFLNMVLARALMNWGGCEAVALDVFDTGRGLLQDALDIDLSRTVGAFALRRYVFLERAPLPGARGYQHCQEQLARQPHRGAGVPLLRHVCDDAATTARARRLPEAPVWFNYAGVVDDFFKAGEGDVYPRPSALMSVIEAVTNHPETQRRRVFCIGGQIAGGKLELVWEYSRALHDEATVTALAAEFAAELARALDALDNEGSR
jgi:amino acid adenylation domain-containing protein/non-ribosomal peptide synthase protein (TIGR01720 family)